MGLIEGLSAAIESDYEDLRSEIRLALAESDYTIGQIAVLADVHERTIYRMLAGNPIKIDSFLRVLYVLGVRFEIMRSGGLPFEVVPLDPTMSRSQDSSSSSSGRKSSRGRPNKVPVKVAQPRKAAAHQRRKSVPRRDEKKLYNEQAA
jgi:hypothetical protein